jgi:hypothetical protein
MGTIATTMVASAPVTSVVFSSTSSDDPRNEEACDRLLKNEGWHDSWTEPDSTHPASDSGVEKANEDSEKALGDCNRQPD